MEELTFVAHGIELPTECHELGEDSGYGGTTDAHIKGIDEDGVEYGVHDDREHSGIHSQTRLGGSTENSVHTKIHMSDYIASQNNLHVVTGIWECLL